MAITYNMAVDGTTLIVTASGFQENLREVQQYGMAIIEAVINNGCERVLCDELALEYRLGTLDLFKSAAFIASKAPRTGRAAIVCQARHAADASFWETVAVNRGLVVRVFQSRADAQKWLNG